MYISIIHGVVTWLANSAAYRQKLCCWLMYKWHLPLAIEILVQLSSPLLSPESSPWSSPESRVQVL